MYIYIYIVPIPHFYDCEIEVRQKKRKNTYFFLWKKYEKHRMAFLVIYDFFMIYL